MLYWDRLYSIKEIFIAHEIDSTNSEALRRIRSENGKHGDLILALSQSDGRGQRGNSWESPEGNIYASLILKHFQSDGESLPILNMAIAYSLWEALNNMNPEDIYTLKWPNDIIQNEKKIGGILIENIWQGTQWQWSVVGFGINLVRPHSGLIHADSIESSDVFIYDKVKEQIKISLIKNIFSSELNSMSILSKYNDHLFNKDKMSRMWNGNEIVEGIIRTVNISGDLGMEINGQIQWFKHGIARLIYSS
jgi:BirA family biotin operon repressor/biotin-[acetyl-CoA-carboxylase] ligase